MEPTLGSPLHDLGDVRATIFALSKGALARRPRVHKLGAATLVSPRRKVFQIDRASSFGHSLDLYVVPGLQSPP
jgi:hypothetical protein